MPASQTLQFLEQALGAQHLLVLFLCVYATWRVAHARQRKALQAVHTRAAAVAAAAAAIATSECFTAEWVNQLLRAVWPTSLEPKIAAKLSASLDTAFAKILKERGHKGPLKYVEGICVERVCLGKQPPLLRMVRAQSSPADNSLRLDFGVGFAPAEGFSVVLALLVRPAKMLPAISAHVELANVSLKGQCRLALTLAPDKAPGISGAMVSFSQAPAIDFDFVPFGLPIGELPYVLDMLKDQLQVVLNAKMVEPNRISVSFDTIGSGEPPIDRSSHSLPLGPLQHQATSAEMITAGSKQSEFDSLRMEKEGELAACKALSDVEGSLEALRKRVAAERLRALVEGAPFLVHAASGTRERFVWFSQLQKALIWADDKVVNGENSTAHTFSLARDSKVTAGAAGVPQQVAGKLHPWRGLPMKLWKSGSVHP
ncbi:hypothetical protein WJX75_005788 [Coccomyxa subellipsoidea]|uniref:SMP-LTD domain-containing protein n=1 Tax=Coccomyxa subellipsoidea TaxID=248742 RepID=A0ABR2YW44_9CHLO